MVNKTSSTNKISVIIRTKNEEKWISFCLESIFSQIVDAKIEVIIVDNNSTDHTVKISRRFPIYKLLKINKFLPGKALNLGIKNATGNFIVCLSAHCIPKEKTWLKIMMDNFSESENIAGVYGRQLPLTFTEPVDKRDLLIVFGKDKRIQKKDSFFHNANSMITRSIWQKFPFDEEATNIEDRIWGKEVIKAGYNIIYEPDSPVFHYHGLHQNNNPDRAKGVVSILEKVEEMDLSTIPQSMMPDNINVASVVPFIGDLTNSKNLKLLEDAINSLKKSKYINNIYCLTYDKKIASNYDVKWINRDEIKNSENLSLNNLLKKSLDMIEKNGDFPNKILYVNYDYINRPENIFDELIYDSQLKGCDTIFPGLIDYGHYWYLDENEDYKQTDPSMDSRNNRNPLYNALYGLGTLTESWLIRKKLLVGGKVAIIKINDRQFSRRLKD